MRNSEGELYSESSLLGRRRSRFSPGFIQIHQVAQNLRIVGAKPSYNPQLMLRSVKVLGSQHISGERGDVSVLVVFFHLFLFFRLFFSGVSSETAWEA